MSVLAPSDILVLSPTPSHPHDFGNRKRIYQICSGLKQRGARICFVHYPLEMDWRSRCPAQPLAMMRAEWDDVHLIPPSVPVHPSARGEDHDIDEWWDPSLEAFLRWYVNVRHFDAMLVNYCYLSKALMLRPRGCLGILDTHDKFSGRRELLASIGIAAEFFHTTENDERVGLERADVVLAIKEQEQALFERMTRRKVTTVPFAEPPRWLEGPAPDAEGYLRVGMLGARNNLNLFNVRRFLNTALPAVRSSLAPIRFVLAGTMCTDLGRIFRGEPAIELMGPVADVRSFYEAVDVVVVPMDVSSGQKIKVGEALGFGVPLISHAHAFEGYLPSDRLHQCNSFEQMAKACIDLAFDRGGLARLSAACKRSGILQGEAADRALDSVIADVRGGRPREVFVVDSGRLSAQPYLQAHLLSMGHLVSAFARVCYLLQGDVGPELERFVAESRAWSTCWVTGERDASALCEGVDEIEGLDALLGLFEFSRAWLYDPCERPRLNSSGPPVGAVRHLAEGIPADQVPATLVNAEGLDFILGEYMSEGGQSKLNVKDAIVSHGIDTMRARAFEAQHLSNGRSGIWIATSRPNERLARAFVHMLLDTREQRPILLIGEVSPDERLASRSKQIVRLSDGAAPPFPPELMIDLTSRDDPVHIYAAMLEGSEIPVWRPAVAASSRANTSAPGMPSGLPLASVVSSFLHITRGHAHEPVPGVSRARLDLAGLYNKLSAAYPRIS